MRTGTAGLVACAIAGAFLLAAATPAHATLEMQKKAKAAGIEAANCLYCHNEKLPAKVEIRKVAVTNNDRGKWLIAEKDKRNAKKIDPAWLKEYTEKK